MIPPSRPVLLAAMAVVLSAGIPVGPGDGALARYDLSAPPADRWDLPRSLQEISGLAVDSVGTIYAHGDERAEIFRLDRTGHRIVDRFTLGEPAVHGDFEGIAVAGSRIFLITSDGVLYAGRPGANGEQVEFVTYATGLGRICEIEGLAYDPSNPSLLIVCKEARVRQVRHRLAVYRWSIDRRVLFPKPAILTGLAPITDQLGEKTFRPSDMTRDPATGNLLILASREYAIAEVTPTGEVIRVSRLRRRSHPQAEGIAVDTDGSLLVADEGAGKRGSLTVYAPAR